MFVNYLIGLLIISLLHKNVDGYRRFFNGRPFRGTVGEPTQKYDQELMEDDIDPNVGIGKPSTPNTTLNSAKKKVIKIKEHWLFQQVDNYSPNNMDTWANRYFVRDKYYEKGGPIFLLLRGEDRLSAPFMISGAWINYAKQFKALCFQLEHRYYGKSFPTNNLTVENLIYLTSEQALADTAHFIRKMTVKYNITTNQKWFLFGGSYAGAMSIWFADLYPNMVSGVISSSGPVSPTVNFKDYLHSVSKTISKYSHECAQNIKKGFRTLKDLLRTPIGQEQLYNSFSLCDTAVNSTDQDKANLIYTLTGDFMYVVQYDKDNTNNNYASVESICNIMNNKTKGSYISRLAQTNNYIMKELGDTCIDFKYMKVIQQLQNSSLVSPVSYGGSRQWLYQTCNEFGFFQTSQATYQIFGNEFPLGFFVNQCVQIFGAPFNQHSIHDNVKKTKLYYGGKNPYVSNVLSVQGSADPWHTRGIYKNNTNGIRALFIPGTAHCADMYKPSSQDSIHLKNARQQIVNYIAEIIKNPKDVSKDLVVIAPSPLPSAKNYTSVLSKTEPMNLSMVFDLSQNSSKSHSISLGISGIEDKNHTVADQAVHETVQHLESHNSMSEKNKKMNLIVNEIKKEFNPSSNKSVISHYPIIAANKIELIPKHSQASIVNNTSIVSNSSAVNISKNSQVTVNKSLMIHSLNEKESIPKSINQYDLLKNLIDNVKNITIKPVITNNGTATNIGQTIVNSEPMSREGIFTTNMHGMQHSGSTLTVTTEKSSPVISVMSQINSNGGQTTDPLPLNPQSLKQHTNILNKKGSIIANSNFGSSSSSGGSSSSSSESSHSSSKTIPRHKKKPHVTSPKINIPKPLKLHKKKKIRQQLQLKNQTVSRTNEKSFKSNNIVKTVEPQQPKKNSNSNERNKNAQQLQSEIKTSQLRDYSSNRQQLQIGIPHQIQVFSNGANSQIQQQSGMKPPQPTGLFPISHFNSNSESSYSSSKTIPRHKKKPHVISPKINIPKPLKLHKKKKIREQLQLKNQAISRTNGKSFKSNNIVKTVEQQSLPEPQQLKQNSNSNVRNKNPQQLQSEIKTSQLRDYSSNRQQLQIGIPHQIRVFGNGANSQIQQQSRMKPPQQTGLFPINNFNSNSEIQQQSRSLPPRINQQQYGSNSFNKPILQRHLLHLNLRRPRPQKQNSNVRTLEPFHRRNKINTRRNFKKTFHNRQPHVTASQSVIDSSSMTKRKNLQRHNIFNRRNRKNRHRNFPKPFNNHQSHVTISQSLIDSSSITKRKNVPHQNSFNHYPSLNFNRPIFSGSSEKSSFAKKNGFLSF